MFPPLFLIIALFMIVFGINSENPFFQYISSGIIVVLVAMLILG